MAIDIIHFGNTKNGDEVKEITLINKNGMMIKTITYGARIKNIFVKDILGNMRDVVLGYDTIADYEEETGCYVGALCGRHANRLENAEVTLDGVIYKLSANQGKNQLHGGIEGFNDKVFEAVPVGESAIKLTYTSKDGEEGFPGNLTLNATYTLTDDNKLILNYKAESDKTTICNITNHSYFNLNSHGDILNHELFLDAGCITENGEGSIPTGKILSVKNTPFDFLKPKKLGAEISADHYQINQGFGYDHNFILNKMKKELTHAATLTADESGIVLKTYTDQPALQIYTSNFLKSEPVGKNGTVYKPRDGVCLETQHFPASPTHEDFPSVVLKKGETYDYTTIFEFGIKGEI